MLKKRVIVCLDVRDGRVVKGTRFRDLRDMGDPAELAERYEREGADEIVFLDISASLEGRRTLLDTVRKTAERLFIPLTVGGGIREVGDVGAVLRAGADKVAINSAAVTRPELITEVASRYGSQCLVVSIDAKRESRGPATRRGQPRGPEWRSGDDDGDGASGEHIFYRVHIRGGHAATELDAIRWSAACSERGAGEILITSIDQDGRRDGYDLDLTARVSRAVEVPVVASGGAGAAEHLRDAFLIGGADAALAAGMFHDRTTTVAEVKRILAESRIAVRRVAA